MVVFVAKHHPTPFVKCRVPLFKQSLPLKNYLEVFSVQKYLAKAFCLLEQIFTICGGFYEVLLTYNRAEY